MFFRCLIILINYRPPKALRRGDEERGREIPKEVWFLCDMMCSLGLGQEQLFLSPGSRDRCKHSTALPFTKHY
jgi:hypothetical protein